MFRTWASVAILAGLAGLSAAQDAPSGTEVVVVGFRPSNDVVVTAPPHCYRRSGDPFDAVPVRRGVTEQRVLAPDRSGQLTWRRDDEPVLGTALWQRAGNAIGDYRFRVPVDGGPMCIGALLRSPNGWGQLRQIIPTKGHADQFAHFTALVATRQAELVRFWLAAAGRGPRSLGGDTHNYPLKGTHGWQQVDLLIGPIPRYADHLSYGFLLYGGGDVWLTAPKIVFLSRADAETTARSIRVTPVETLLPYGQH